MIRYQPHFGGSTRVRPSTIATVMAASNAIRTEEGKEEVTGGSFSAVCDCRATNCQPRVESHLSFELKDSHHPTLLRGHSDKSACAAGMGSKTLHRC